MAGGGGNEPNLTPFIDLFSVLICFLLMTAAWIQLESLPVQIEKAPTPTTTDSDSSPPPEDKKKVELSVRLFGDKILAKENENLIEIKNIAGIMDDSKVRLLLKMWRDKYPDKSDLVLYTDASVTYGQMIRVYDFLVSSEFKDVGINPY